MERAFARILSAMVIAAISSTLASLAAAQEASPVGSAREAAMEKVRISVAGGPNLIATLAQGDAARDFASLLPLNLLLKDYASTEKIADLPKRLSTTDAPDGFEPRAGDVAYYAPWGNLAIFYRDFRVLARPGAPRASRCRKF